jgi:hypothetical protein
MKKFNALRACAHTTVGKIAAGSAAIMASGAALASGGGASPGAAIAGELSGGKADMALIIGAVAVFIGFLLVWAYTKRAAK